MDNESHIYNLETLISPHTNRPVQDAVKKDLPIFWCETCHLRLKTAHTAIQHLGGRQHKAKINVNNTSLNQNQKNTSKRKIAIDSETVIKEPVVKKLKEQPTKQSTKPAKKDEVQPAKAVKPDPNLSCEDCKLVFASATMAIQHFKGKRHMAAVAAKLKAKQSQTISRWQGRDPGTQAQRGKGREGRGRGRDDGNDRFNKYGRFSRGAAAGQLIRALNNFYCQPADKSLDGSTYNSWMNTSGDTQHIEPQHNFDIGINSEPSNYGTPQYLKDNLGQSKEYFTSNATPNDNYNSNMQSAPMNYYDGSAPTSTMSTNNFTGGSGNYFADY